MTGWLIAIAYVVIWLIYGWRLTVYVLDKETRQWLAESPRLTVREAGAQAWDVNGMIYFVVAFPWPLVMPARALYRLAQGRDLFVTPVEREYAEKAELAALRQLAKDNGLDFPEVKS